VPSVNQKQHNLMAMVANNPAKAKQLGIPQSVGKEFTQADKGKKFGAGAPKTRPDRQVTNRAETHHGKEALFKKGGQIMATKSMNKGITNAKMGAVRTAAPSKDGIAAKGKTKGMMPKMSASKPLGMKKGGATKKMAYGGKAC